MIGKQTMTQSDQINSSQLDLRDFFEHFDRGDPYMLSAIGVLQEQINSVDPLILTRQSEWFQTWQWAGKR